MSNESRFKECQYHTSSNVLEIAGSDNSSIILDNKDIDHLLQELAYHHKDKYTELIGDTISYYYRTGDVSKLSKGFYILGAVVFYQYLKLQIKRCIHRVDHIDQKIKDKDFVKNHLKEMNFIHYEHLDGYYDETD